MENENRENGNQDSVMRMTREREATRAKEIERNMFLLCVVDEIIHTLCLTPLHNCRARLDLSSQCTTMVRLTRRKSYIIHQYRRFRLFFDVTVHEEYRVYICTVD